MPLSSTLGSRGLPTPHPSTPNSSPTLTTKSSRTLPLTLSTTTTPTSSKMEARAVLSTPPAHPVARCRHAASAAQLPETTPTTFTSNQQSKTPAKATAVLGGGWRLCYYVAYLAYATFTGSPINRAPPPMLLQSIFHSCRDHTYVCE
jgi:hypothetical protein